ncbi:MAG TPA: hypothetical protein VNF47_11615 [Streptosporangiaceae bacterium]|nr:hypothetical protein [Streptosporangiaceae bacterium]
MLTAQREFARPLEHLVGQLPCGRAPLLTADGTAEAESARTRPPPPFAPVGTGLGVAYQPESGQVPQMPAGDGGRGADVRRELGGGGRTVALQPLQQGQAHRMRERAHRLGIGDLEVTVQVGGGHISDRESAATERVKRLVL